MKSLLSRLLFLLWLPLLICRADNLGLPYANESQKFRPDVESADLIRVRTGGVPDLEPAKSQTILEIKGDEKVREFLAPLKLFGPKKYAASCDCLGDPTIEIYKHGRLVTAIAIKHSASLAWPDNWPADMIIESLDFIDHLNSEMAEKGSPQYKQEFEKTLQMVNRMQKNRPNTAARFYKDPYDSRFDSGAVYAVSDDRKWDTDCPNHPLSRTRRKMKFIMDSLKLSEEIRRIALYHESEKSIEGFYGLNLRAFVVKD